MFNKYLLKHEVRNLDIQQTHLDIQQMNLDIRQTNLGIQQNYLDMRVKFWHVHFFCHLTTISICTLSYLVPFRNNTKSINLVLDRPSWKIHVCSKNKWTLLENYKKVAPGKKEQIFSKTVLVAASVYSWALMCGYPK